MSETPPAGWYPDPQMAATQRYWDGTAWTEHVAPLTTAGAAAGPTVPCPYCGTAVGFLVRRCPACAGEITGCAKCQGRVGVRRVQKFVGFLHGGTRWQTRCLTCNSLLSGPRF